MQSITPAELSALDTVGSIIDVREVDEVAAVRIAGSVNIPMSAFMERLQEVPLDETVYVLCAVGGRSSQVANYLDQRGYDVVNVDGGIVGWERAGLAVERGPVA
ncbi:MULTISPECIES: rhodanese-like domain-containing protein [unclassified Leifsonia]|uniref:rhodanese-like domain-containing protein n=1 Tax=unclassified Leifsonia TaxID=2663824 RepID=UPI0006F94A73|nr:MULTISPECIES: rhodanese-like domain-containing protein [unclassified Leifsonia]KQX07499.1 sulfurtransferase [Leifsonia sp. Root1293]KRA11781.1 sulfurtransferase [Leifsonia sp. Root60]